MSPKEALNLLASIAVQFMIQVNEETQPKILEARKVLRELIEKNGTPKKDKNDD